MFSKIKIIWQYVRPYKWNAFGNISFNIIQIFFSLFSLVLIGPFLNILFSSQTVVTEMPQIAFSAAALKEYFYYHIGQLIIEQGKPAALLFVSMVVIIMIFFKNFFLYFANFFMAPLRNGIVKDIRNKIYKKILSLPLAYYSEERKGDIISRISNDVKEIEWSVMRSLETAFRDPFTILFYLAAMIWMSPGLTLFLLILLPLSGAIIGIAGRTLRRDSSDAQARLGTLLASAEEALSGLRIIKAFNAQRQSQTRFYKQNQAYTKVMNRISRKQYLASPMSEVLGVMVMIIVMYYGGSMVLSNESDLSPEEFIAFIAIFSQIITPAKAFASAFFEIKKGLASIDRVNVIMAAEEQITEKKNAISIDRFDTNIEFKNVSFKYKDIYVLKNINLTISKGKTVALVGESGSGKSTLADLLPRFYDIEEGEILIDGTNIKDLKIKDLRGLMGNVNQDAILFNDTVANNISFGTEGADGISIEAAAKIANAHQFIIETEKKYQTNVGDRGTKLSGGQRQRLSIARAVLKNPPILILDEATSALDTESEKLVQDALTHLMENRTSIVIAHRLSTIKNADTICVLSKGKIIERGLHAELIKQNGVYKKLHDLQSF